MKMKKWLAASVTLTFALATAGAVTAFALTGDVGGDKPEPTDLPTDSNAQVLHGDPTYEEGLSDQGDGTVVTSIDDIDPNVCNTIHNINACTPEELEELGMATTSGPVAVQETSPPPVEVAGDPEPGTDVEGEIEPLFVDEEPNPHKQSHEEAVVQDCNLAGGLASVTSDGEVECHLPDLEDGGEGETQGQPPVVAPHTDSRITE